MIRPHLLLRLDGRGFAVPLADVAEVLRAVRVTPVPDAPAFVLGAVDVRGEWCVVLDLRHRLGLPSRPLEPGHRLVLADGAPYGFPVDAAEGLVDVDDAAVAAMAGVEAELGRYCRGVVSHDGEAVLLFDRESLFGGASWRDGVRRALAGLGAA